MAECIEREALRDALYDADAITMNGVKILNQFPSADVAPVMHGRCPVCSGNAVLTQDCDNGYSLEVDAEQQETSLWYGDECLAVFHIDYCPNCGAKMDLEVTNDA